jgi:stage II sporulation protein D (peptidoglycan lytic transglycosylase)
MKKIYIGSYLVILLSIILVISGCSSGSRYATKENVSATSTSIPIRVLVSDGNNNLVYKVDNDILLYSEEKEIAIVKKGNTLSFSSAGNQLDLAITDKTFHGKYFEIKTADNGNTISYNSRHYRGYLKFISEENKVKVINRVSLEDYLKGVVPAEMPIGPGESYFQALKAFAICARTYAVMKMENNNSLFDVYLDTRDQVYNGTDAEKALSNKAVDKTRNLILTYNDKPAKVFYSAACGGHTENASNVFSGVNEPYLKGVIDGDPPYCSIERGFEWKETYPANVFIDRLFAAGFISNKNFILKNVDVSSRFESGRVNELQITLETNNGDKKIVVIKGNNIRTIIKTSNNRHILRSTMFNISIDDNGDVIIQGKGNGHGVGLCQWGAIDQSIQGKNYKQILSFYFPGTDIQELK